MESGLLLPDIEDPESAPFWEGTARGELLVQTCASCGHRRMPPRPMCPSCRSTQSAWEPSSGRGSIWSFVVPHPPLLPAYAALAPYNVVLVSLEEDPNIRFVGNLVTSADAPPGGIDPTTIRIGEAVEVVFSLEGDVRLPRWIRR
jgi:uncharacterized OB-fold protein